VSIIRPAQVPARVLSWAGTGPATSVGGRMAADGRTWPWLHCAGCHPLARMKKRLCPKVRSDFAQRCRGIRECLCSGREGREGVKAYACARGVLASS
jgi:hypothetical protein